ncbi:hypothetical protein SDC9_152161 [bioreactor metagenome]|uniref:Uncharacterized protein n=1 Tax=bioreactor metagenome TaxID=1076179 RepID=A0A645EWN8_9ZZZZ
MIWSVFVVVGETSSTTTFFVTVVVVVVVFTFFCTGLFCVVVTFDGAVLAVEAGVVETFFSCWSNTPATSLSGTAALTSSKVTHEIPMKRASADNDRRTTPAIDVFFLIKMLIFLSLLIVNELFNLLANKGEIPN